MNELQHLMAYLKEEGISDFRTLSPEELAKTMDKVLAGVDYAIDSLTKTTTRQANIIDEIEQENQDLNDKLDSFSNLLEGSSDNLNDFRIKELEEENSRLKTRVNYLTTKVHS